MTRDAADFFNGILRQHADTLARVSEAVTPDTYRGWTIRYDPPPIPVRSFDWQATGPNYDASWEGEEDGWVDNGEKANAPTREALIEAIDEWFEENGDD